jgi:hypothetical protein
MLALIVDSLKATKIPGGSFVKEDLPRTSIGFPMQLSYRY